MSTATLGQSTQRTPFASSSVDDGARSVACAEWLTADGKNLDEEDRDRARALAITVLMSTAATVSIAASAAFLLLR